MHVAACGYRNAGTAIHTVVYYDRDAVDKSLFRNVHTLDTYRLVDPHTQFGRIITENLGTLKRAQALSIRRHQSDIVYKIPEHVAGSIINVARDCGVYLS